MTMLTGLFSAKGSPGVTSTALVLAAVWPRSVLLIEADLTGSDVVYRCRSEAGGAVAASPSVLGLASAMRGSRSAVLSDWSQRLACGVDVITGVTTPSQARGLSGEFWRSLAVQAMTTDVDVIVDFGRLDRDAATMSLATGCDVLVPVVASALDSVMHARELLRDLVVDGPRLMPLLVGPARTAGADALDVDEILATAGVMSAPTLHLPLDHPGLTSLQAGTRPSGRGRGHLLVRAARTAAAQLRESSGIEAGP